MAERPNDSQIITTEGKALTILQQRFADIYFSMPEPNQRKAYIEAGYKSRGATADVNACRLLKNDKVKSYLSKLREAVTKRTEIDGAKVVTELGKLAFSNIKQYLDIEGDEVYFKDLKNVTDEQTAAIESVKVMKKIIRGKKKGDDDIEIQTIQFKLHNKPNALEQLAKHFGIFKEDNAQKAIEIRTFGSYEEINVYIEDCKANDKRIAAAGTGIPV